MSRRGQSVGVGAGAGGLKQGTAKCHIGKCPQTAPKPKGCWPLWAKHSSRPLKGTSARKGGRREGRQGRTKGGKAEWTEGGKQRKHTSGPGRVYPMQPFPAWLICNKQVLEIIINMKTFSMAEVAS